MVDVLATVLLAAGLALGAWCLVWAGRNRTVDRHQLAGAALVELAVVAQVAVAAVKLATGQRPSELAVFVGYLVAVLLVLPAGVALALAERTRWGSVLLGAAGLVLAVLVLRLRQVWSG